MSPFGPVDDIGLKCEKNFFEGFSGRCIKFQFTVIFWEVGLQVWNKMDYDKIKDTSLDRHMPHREFVLQMRRVHCKR